MSIKTTSAGSDWSESFNTGDIWPYAMHFPSPDTGYIVGEDLGIVVGDYNIVRTYDGGQSATSQFIDTENSFYSVFFVDPDVG